MLKQSLVGDIVSALHIMEDVIEILHNIQDIHNVIRVTACSSSKLRLIKSSSTAEFPERGVWDLFEFFGLESGDAQN